MLVRRGGGSGGAHADGRRGRYLHGRGGASTEGRPCSGARGHGHGAPGAALGGKMRCSKIRFLLAKMIKLQRARSLLYRSRFLQPNTHFLKAFFKIHTIHTTSHRSQFKVSQTFVKRVRIFVRISAKNHHFLQFEFSSKFNQILMIFSVEFAEHSGNVEKSYNFQNV